MDYLQQGVDRSGLCASVFGPGVVERGVFEEQPQSGLSLGVHLVGEEEEPYTSVCWS